MCLEFMRSNVNYEGGSNYNNLEVFCFAPQTNQIIVCCLCYLYLCQILTLFIIKEGRNKVGERRREGGRKERSFCEFHSRKQFIFPSFYDTQYGFFLHKAFQSSKSALLSSAPRRDWHRTQDRILAPSPQQSIFYHQSYTLPLAWH